ncbi:MAG: tetratricopeptide repeat protein [Pseudohongiella sp.]|nr:tetratricopeptide repeat protein [Pseudohongiella sp.]
MLAKSRFYLKVLSVLVLTSSLGNALAQTPADLSQLMRQGESGDAAAQFELGNRYLNGSGVEQDNFEALRWFTLAAEQENRNAQYNIAVMYLNGIGVIKDAEQAIAWFLRAAENGDPPSQFTLGIALFNGQLGVPQNTAEAYKWFTLAGAAGHQSAAANAVLVQELLPPDEVMAKQEEAKAWIAAYKARQSPPVADVTEQQP